MSQRLCFLKMLVFAGLVAVCVSGAQASIIIDTVPVGNPGNAADTSWLTEGYGGVAYSYNIGKFETTTGQYTAFLNAVAATDTYGLYNTNMGTPVYSYGCNIHQTGSSGSYTYTVGNGTPTDVANWANRPVNYVSWGDSARFANWLHNGQPAGAQGLSTTEDGAYFLNGATSDAALLAVTRKANWQWAITSEDEWYKAAYHKNDGVTGNYWAYPTGTNAVPNNGNPGGDTGNSANFFDYSDYTIGSPYWRTNVGFFGQSDSPYGTFDQGGNVWEWNEAIILPSARCLRGGTFYVAGSAHDLHASDRDQFYYPTSEDFGLGFRVVAVDVDGDGVPDSQDNCPGVANPDQADCDSDGTGDACEQDSDNDGVPDDCDNCPTAANPDQANCDGDAYGDVCDDDRDGDGVPNDVDICPDTPGCSVMPDGRPRLDLNNDCNVDGMDMQLIVQQLLGGCTTCP